MDRLSIPASEALIRADREARGLGHLSVGLPHVLLGLAGAPGGGARRVLLRRGVHSDTLRGRVETLLPPCDEASIDLDRTPIEQLVHALHDDAAAHVRARPVTTGDLLLAVLRARDRLTSELANRYGLQPDELVPALDAEEHAAPEPGRAVLRDRPGERPTAISIIEAEPITDVFEALLEIRSLLRKIADRTTAGTASPTETRVAADLEGSIAGARLRLLAERRGSIGIPRSDELAQRRFVLSLREAFVDASAILLGDRTVDAVHDLRTPLPR